jgi:hypothetical protein
VLVIGGALVVLMIMDIIDEFKSRK